MKTIRIIPFSCLILFLILAAAGFFYYLSVWRPALEMTKRENIEKIILAESPVYYENGKDVIGVFFQEEHRRYLKFKDIPTHFINAIIAAEDQNFYKHFGFDLKSIMRALFVNMKSGRVVQGGSTITQQTAKNIFKRERRSLKSKIKELVHALILESYYTKSEILEFYSNQFFVNGNGRGIGVAAEYFFNKPAGQLNLVECAFIAAAVKGPSRYNPFTKKTPEAKERAKLFAGQRTDYVLKHMYELGAISLMEYERTKGQPIPFEEGQIGYRLNVILDYIREQLQTKPFDRILREQGIDNIATSGFKIYTTIDKEIQQGALLAFRKGLSLLETKLRGYDRKRVQGRYAVLKGGKPGRPRIGDFCLGRVSKVVTRGDASYVDVEFEGAKGRIGYSGLLRLGNAWMQSRLGEQAKFHTRHVKQFLTLFRRGDLVLVHVKGDGLPSHVLELELEQRPEVEGGLVVLKNGELKAMVGGFENEFFNRAVDAKRQLGSVFKPIVYTAALQLGWNNLDALENSERTFEFENTRYSVRPHHEALHGKVSMTWAGVKSENIATVWLLYHLCDRLNMNQFRHTAEKVGLTQRTNESYNEYRMRIRDQNGVVVGDKARMEAAFGEAKKELVTDLIFEGEHGAVEVLNGLSLEQFSDEGIRSRLASDTIDRLAGFTQKQYQSIKELNPYDFRVLSRIRDFRVLAGLKYVVKLAQEMGVSSPLDEVLSFPLGSNPVSVLEASLVYHTMLSGKIYPVGENGSVKYAPIIKKIEDRDGAVIYEYSPRGVSILDNRISTMITPILRHAVKHGTGKRAEGSITLKIKNLGGADLHGVVAFGIPAFGKTGTSNDYTNASFCGFIPGPAGVEKGLNLENSYVIAAYLGHDNNSPLTSKHVKIHGASGVLPFWIDTAQAIVNTKRYAKSIDPVDLVFQGAVEIPLPKAPGMVSVVVNPATGLPQNPDARNGGLEEFIRVESYGQVAETGFTPHRFFLPFP